MKYGEKEYAYAAPFASTLATDAQFRAWVLRQTPFAEFADTATVLVDEMKAARSEAASNWWRSHYSERCRCAGCSGQETDLLAIFVEPSGKRFALHVEVKQPTDNFPKTRKQGENYCIRAACWVGQPPPSVLAHHDASTMLLCSAFRLKDYGDQARCFDTTITFERLRLDYPEATPSL